MPPNTTSLSNIDAVVMAVFNMGGESVPVDLEDIAFEADRVAPNRFRWLKYTDQINLYRVRYAVKDAQTEGLLSGATRRGWQLSPDGLAAAHRLAAATASGDRTTDSVELVRRRRQELERLTALSAWSKFHTGGPVPRREARAVFRINDYTTENRARESYDRMLMLFAEQDAEPFVREMWLIATQENT